jgi:hypothetical protein
MGSYKTKLLQMADDGLVSWETIAREYIQQNSDDHAECICDSLGLNDDESDES